MDNWTQRSALITAQCIDLLNNIAILEVLRDDRTVALTNSEKYAIQVKLYENHQEIERQRKHTEKLAKKERKHAEKEARRQREHERELELAKLAHERKKLESNEKRDDKKHLHQNQVLAAAADRPVMLTVG